ncbi:helix-turn-helix transcriptional regulator [Parendozoicomonas haliclonae]|uniref:Transcriptional activator FtrA n=1 Tax=Parendozoicomonas haliclonae TaxID=1960125 RepID=A0A1X7ANM4_9GAMM|nr:AraC family transcriptional regulator [Parendozoicomonas haliclonae]SMA49921.1 transcriptional activator FtrA [Parendozoicomonas haliclonae]
MNDAQTSINLIPEQHLIAALSPLWQRRFEKAIHYIAETLDQSPPPSWDEVARRCAISPSHFHRIFKVAFNETPGQYTTRLRLQWAITLLLDSPDTHVNEVALECGFSSSQALAKALQRNLQITAKAIRKLQRDQDYQSLEKLLARVGHPEISSGKCLERNLAINAGFHIVSHDDRYVYAERIKADIYSIINHWYTHLLKASRPLYLCTPAEAIGDNPIMQEWLLAGHEVPPGTRGRIIPAGDYLSCRVTINNDVSYLATWDAMFDYMIRNDLEPDDDGCAVEIIHDPKTLLSHSMEMTISLKLRDK